MAYEGRGLYLEEFEIGKLYETVGRTITGLSNQSGIYEGTTIAFLELTAKYLAPLCIGDTVHLEMVPTEARHSSKPGKGILKVMTKLVNQEGTVILESPWTFMMKARE